MLTNKCEVVENFLHDVDDQIQYVPLHAVINEELVAHIEDKAEMYISSGIEETIAYEKAVCDMGDADVLGIQMNAVHKLRTAKPLFSLIIVLTSIGFIGNILDGGLFSMLDSSYFLWGLFVLYTVFVKGYPTLLKYAGGILKIFFALLITWIGVFFIRRITDIQFFDAIFLKIYSPTLLWGILQLSILVITIILYRNRKLKWKILLFVYGYEALIILIYRITYINDETYIPVLTMVIACSGVVLYMVLKRYLDLGKIKGCVAAITGTTLLLVLFCTLQWTDVSRNFQMFINPNLMATTTSAWDDSYNNVLIRELFSKAELFGEIKLSQQELVRYGTSQWYYEDDEKVWSGYTSPYDSLEEEVSYRIKYLENPALEDVLPQHYLNNYRIALWIFKYGWIPAFLLVVLLLSTQIVAFWTSFRIHNCLGRLIAISGSITLLVQNLFYILGNFGFQFGKFGNLPFVAEGWISITGTMVVAGLILSAYRFDMVIKE